MAFTHDELNSLNVIMEQKLANQREELEQAFNQRAHALKDELEQRIVSSQQQTVQAFTQALQEQRLFLQETLQQGLAQRHTQVIQAVMHKVEQHQQDSEESVARALAAQLLAIEQLITQRLGQNDAGDPMYYNYNTLPVATPDFETIEVQTEIPWDELVEMIDHRLDERFTGLRYALISAVKDVERYLALQIHSLRDVLKQERNVSHAEPDSGTLENMQDVFRSLEQLEHLIEAMQVAMTANSALLSNRLYHHQQLPLERAHSTHHIPDVHEISPLAEQGSDAASHIHDEQVSRRP